MRGPPVVLTNTLGRPVTNVISERGAVPMTVVNTLGEPVTLVAQGGEPVTLFNANGTLWDYPFSLFSNNEQGAWYDPSDFSTLFQNSTGTTPVTAVEQPVRLMLDRSRGLVLGSELVTINSATLTGSTGFTAITGASCVAGRSYSVSYTCVLSGGTIQGVVGGTALTSTSVSGTFSFIVVATSSVAPQFYSSAGVGSISNYSVRELPGNHALAPNDASRPVLRSRYNLLTYSEQFDNAAWAKTNATVTSGVADPFGGTKAFTLTATSNNGDILQSVSNPGGTAASITQAIWVRRRTGTGTVSLFNLNAGGITTITVTSSWQLFSVTGPGAASLAYAGLRLATSGDAVDIAFASLLTSADQTSTGGAYQRIAAATDYDTSNPVWRPYLAFDGSDDSFSTSAIDFSATDEMTVFAGVSKLAAAGIIVETSATASANAGAIQLYWASTNYQMISGGTTSNTILPTANSAPSTDVATLVADISLPVLTGRVNGVQAATSTSTQGTGNFGNYPLFIGRRNNINLPFNGRLYSLAVLGRTATAAELGAMEAWVNGKTGAY